MTSRRFSLAPLAFLGLWALWFALPLTREVARAGWKARFAAAPSHPPAPVVGNSRDAQFVRAMDVGDRAKRVAALEALGRAFPRDPAICAAQVVMQTDLLRLYARRQPGPSSSPDFNWSVTLAKVYPVPPAFLQSWFAATARGAALEPNNTFWDWAQIMGLLAANRDEEVWAVLRTASGKTAYDDHLYEGALARLRVQGQAGPMSPITQIGIGAATFFSLDAAMREAARQLSDDASGLRLAGGAAKKKQALEGMRDFALLARVMRLQAKSFIGSLVGEAIEGIALYGGSYFPMRLGRRRHPRSGSPAYFSDPRSLFVFAQNLHRPDIAAPLASEWKALGTQHNALRKSINSLFYLALNPRDAAWAQAGDWLGALFLMAIPPLLGWALVTSILLRIVPAWRREVPVALSHWSWGMGAPLMLFATVMLSAAMLWKLVPVWRTPGSYLLDWLLAMDAQNSDRPLVPFEWQTYFPALLGALLAFHVACAWNKRRLGKPSLGVRLRRIFHPPDDDMARFDLSPLLALTATLFLFFVLMVGVAAYLIVPTLNSDVASMHDYALPVLLGLGFVLALPVVSSLRNAAEWAFALQLARRFAWAQLIWITLAWGLLWMGAAPAEARFSAQYTRQLRVGEFQLARKKLGI